MPVLPIRLEAVAHIPHGSGDAEYHLIDADADADNSDALAIIDPHMAMDDPAAFAERLALASNSHEALVNALQQIESLCVIGQEFSGAAQNALNIARAALATAREG